MTRRVRTVCVSTLAIVLCSFGVPAGAQPQRPQPAPAAQATSEADGDAVPLRVTIVFSRSKGETPASTLPFELFIRANTRAAASINIGVDVPVPAGSNAITYRRVGNNITCSSARYQNGLVTLELQVEESSIHADVPPAAPAGSAVPGPPPAGPVFRSFTTATVVSMLEGQTVQLTLATDKQTGETLKVSVMAARVR